MGRHLNIKTGLTLFGVAAAFVLGSSGALPITAEARVPAAQTYPVISLNTPLARDAQTFEADKALEATCRKNGQEKAVCLCVTHILKYELTLSEYRAVTRLYGQKGDRNALRQSLKDEGFKSAEIKMAEEMEQSLVEDKDFALRCAEAKAYYNTTIN